MKNDLPYIHTALTLFSPENGLDHATAAKLLEHQLEAAKWRAGLVTELVRALEDDDVDWMRVVANDAFCMGDFDGHEEAKSFVFDLLLPIVRGPLVDIPT